VNNIIKRNIQNYYLCYTIYIII